MKKVELRMKEEIKYLTIKKLALILLKLVLIFKIF